MVKGIPVKSTARKSRVSAEPWPVAGSPSKVRILAGYRDTTHCGLALEHGTLNLAKPPSWTLTCPRHSGLPAMDEVMHPGACVSKGQ